MGETKSSTPRVKRSFTEEFKQDAMSLVTIQKYCFAVAAKALGISEQSLRPLHSLHAPKACGERRCMKFLPAGLRKSWANALRKNF